MRSGAGSFAKVGCVELSRAPRLRSVLPELAERNVVDPDRAGSFDDEPEVDEVRVAGVEHMSILAPSSEFVSDVGSSGPLRIGRQKEGLRLRPAHQRPEGCRIEGSWSQPRDSLGERSPLTVGLLTVVVESECGRSGAAVGRIQHPTRVCAAARSAIGDPKVRPFFEAAIAYVVPEQPRLFLFGEEPCAGATQRARYENGRQDNAHGMRLPQPGPYMASNRSGGKEQAITDHRQSNGSVNPPRKVEHEPTDVPAEQSQRNASRSRRAPPHLPALLAIAS